MCFVIFLWPTTFMCNGQSILNVEYMTVYDLYVLYVFPLPLKAMHNVVEPSKYLKSEL